MTAYKTNLKRHEQGYQLELDGRDLVVFTEQEMADIVEQYNTLEADL